MKNSIDKKLRLLSLLPYGFCSKQALYLTTKIPEIAAVAFDPNMPMAERERLMQQASTSITRAVERMIKTGYIEEQIRKHGPTQDDQFRMIRLTQAGFYLLTSTPDKEVEWARQDFMGHISLAQLQSNTYWSNTEHDEDLRELNCLRQKENTLTEQELQEIESSFLEAMDTGEMIPLACASEFARSIDITNSRYNGMRLYRFWMLANVNALFLVNGFLTYLDRRPMGTGWAIGSIHDRASMQNFLASGEPDIPAYMYYALL